MVPQQADIQAYLFPKIVCVLSLSLKRFFEGVLNLLYLIVPLFALFFQLFCQFKIDVVNFLVRCSDVCLAILNFCVHALLNLSYLVIDAVVVVLCLFDSILFFIVDFCLKSCTLFVH